MNDLQIKEFELLECFIAICNKLNINYFLVCGSALGAVKYKGFIPWDDDVDVALYRDDYDLFMENANKYLPPYIFLQNYKSDSAFPAIFSKLRNSETTYIEKSASRLPINHGIYIDIFPLDGYPVKKLEQNVFEIRKKIYKRLLSVAFLPNRKWKYIFILPFRVLGVHKKTALLARKYEKMITAYKINESEIVANHGNWQGKLDYSPIDHYGDGVLVEFEGIKVRIPEKYDLYLKQKYGDYRLDLSESDKKGHHYYKIYDCNKSYREYCDCK